MSAIVKNSTDQTIDIFVQDSSVSTGAGLTGLTYLTANLKCYYRRGPTGTPTELPLATQSVGGAHSDGGFVAVDGTNCPGQYRLDLSDAIVATGVDRVYLYLKGATNMSPVLREIELVDNVSLDSSGHVTLAAGSLTSSKFGAGAIDAAAIADGAIDAGAIASNTITAAKFASGAITAAAYAANAITSTVIADDAITAAKVAADAVTEIQSGLATAAALTTVDDFLDTEIAAIKAKTDQLTFTDTNRVDSTIQSTSVNTLRKNVARANYMFKMVDETDLKTAETGATVTATRSIDGAAFAACANSIAEVSNGWYKIDLATTDLNGDVIVLRFTGTGCHPYEAVIITQPT